jgi:phosphatidylserine synthase
LKSLGILIYKNVANLVSILGLLPLCILFIDGGYQYLIPLLIFNNVMDDLDGILASTLNIRSDFGARLDNVCDAIAHTIFAMLVGMQFGGVCAVASLIASAGIVVRSVSRLDSGQRAGIGSPTNELMRHLLFILLLSQSFDIGAGHFLTAAFLIHTVSMLAPYKLPYLIRSLAVSPISIGLVNVSLLVAWAIPAATSAIAASFILTYLYSLIAPLLQRNRTISNHLPSTGED